MPAFSAAECDAVRDWVRNGGSLLLISDHAPFGAAAAPLAQRFGVVMGQGWAYDHSDTEPGITTQLVFSRANGLLGDHPILRGRGPKEEVTRVKTFTGQSISTPLGATTLLKLSATAGEASTPAELEAADASRRGTATSPAANARASSAAGRAQGIAMTFGRGRLVVIGEAAMFSAQVVRFSAGNEQREMKMGMNVPDSDDRQFALNVVHWLSGLLK